MTRVTVSVRLSFSVLGEHLFLTKKKPLADKLEPCADDHNALSWVDTSARRVRADRAVIGRCPPGGWDPPLQLQRRRRRRRRCCWCCWCWCWCCCCK